MQQIDKAWGSELVLVNEPEYCAKILNILPRKKCSLHYHNQKKETFIVQSGVIRLEWRDVRGTPINQLLFLNESRTIMPGTPHRFSSVEGGKILEISTHHSDEDVVRIEPSGDL